MHRQVGDLKINKEGIAKSGLIVRHIVMPDEVANTREVMKFLATNISKNTFVNLVGKFWTNNPKLQENVYNRIARNNTEQEYTQALKYAKDAGIHRFERRQA